MQPSLFAVLLFAGMVSGQSATSPKGFLRRPGNASFRVGVTPFLKFKLVTQVAQLDETHKGMPRMIRSFYLRRSNAEGDARATARQMRFSIRIAHGDRSKLTGRPQSLADGLVGSWQNSMLNKRIRLPDMTRRPRALPAPWSVVLPLDRPFAYDGKNGLYIHMIAWDTAVTPQYPLDAYNEIEVISPGSSYGRGRACRVGSREIDMTARFRVRSWTKAVILELSSFPGTASVRNATFAFVGATNPNLSIAGFCAPLLSSAELIVPMTTPLVRTVGQTRIKGWAALLRLVHEARLVGIEVFAQAWAFDANRRPPFAASRGYRSGKYPARPTRRTAVDSATRVVEASGRFMTRASFQANTGVIFGF